MLICGIFIFELNVRGQIFQQTGYFLISEFVMRAPTYFLIWQQTVSIIGFADSDIGKSQSLRKVISQFLSNPDCLMLHAIVRQKNFLSCRIWHFRFFFQSYKEHNSVIKN